MLWKTSNFLANPILCVVERKKECSQGTNMERFPGHIKLIKEDRIVSPFALKKRKTFTIASIFIKKL